MKWTYTHAFHHTIHNLGLCLQEKIASPSPSPPRGRGLGGGAACVYLRARREFPVGTGCPPDRPRAAEPQPGRKGMTTDSTDKLHLPRLNIRHGGLEAPKPCFPNLCSL